MKSHRIPLLVLGTIVLASMAGIARIDDLGRGAHALLLLWGAAHVAYLAAAALVLRGPREGRSGGPSLLAIVLAIGLLARAFLIPTAPTLSEDAYRYLWDGRLVASGTNPFPHPPNDPALERFHDELSHRLNHGEVPTIYPPAAQLAFGAVARIAATPQAWKIALLLLEVLLVGSLLHLLRRVKLPSERILLYYWNPLVLVESFGSGHLDLMAASFLLASIALHESRRAIPAGVSFAAAVLTKLVPGLLTFWWIRRRAWLLLLAALAAGAALTVPFVGAGPALATGLGIYARHWEFNGALYRILRELIDSEVLIRLLLAAAGLVAVIAISRRARSSIVAAYGVLVAFLLFSPTVFPWYAVPAVAFLPLLPDPGLLAFSGLAALTYLPLPAYRETGAWTLPAWILWVEYGGLLLAWVLALAAAGRRRRARAAVGSGPSVRVDEREHAHVEKPE